MGWVTPSFGSSNMYFIDEHNIDHLICNLNSTNALNLFSGLNAYDSVHYAFLKVLNVPNSRVALMMEKVTYNKLNYILKFIKYYILNFKYGKSIDFILSHGGSRFLKSVGFERVYDFAYFLSNSTDVKQNTLENDTLRLLYIGEISKRKRIVDLTLHLSEKLSKNWALDIYGPESDVSIVELSLNENIRYLGTIAHSNVHKIIPEYDYLVLPSQQEGWGVVLCEALSCGVGIVASDIVGSKDYIENLRLNETHFLNFNNMNEAIDFIIKMEPLNAEQRMIILSKSYLLEAKNGAEQFVKILNAYYENFN